MDVSRLRKLAKELEDARAAHYLLCEFRNVIIDRAAIAITIQGEMPPGRTVAEEHLQVSMRAHMNSAIDDSIADLEENIQETEQAIRHLVTTSGS